MLKCNACGHPDCPKVTDDPYWARCPADYRPTNSWRGRHDSRELQLRMAVHQQRHAAECYAAARAVYGWRVYSYDSHAECLRFQAEAQRCFDRAQEHMRLAGLGAS